MFLWKKGAEIRELKKKFAEDRVGLIIKSLVSLSEIISSFVFHKNLLKSREFHICVKNIHWRSLPTLT